MLRDEKGLTLLELMISIVLIGTIILVVSGAMRLGYRSVSSGERKIDSLERFKSSLTIISAQMQSGVPLIFEQDGKKRFYFEGTSDFLKMATNYSIWGGQKGYVTVEYQIETDINGIQNLVASESLIGTKKKNETRLLKGFNAIYFEYFFKDVTEKEGVWVDEWKDNTRIPQKIRLHLIQGKREFSIIFLVKTQISLTGIYSDRSLPERFQVYGYDV
jgi:prepilin-type N-terminal cleavage/methylation domain-containing protein